MSDWPPEPIPPVGYLSRKALPIKRNDAEILTREDVQYDLLEYIFADQSSVFTPQTPGASTKITFRELYVNALYHSNKCSKVLKEKMVETPAFGVELAKISLLTNVGRINTTMACKSFPEITLKKLMLKALKVFPEMKTALRTYHPVPSLQKSEGNAQDAPRIKNCLKAALLPSEFKTVPPSTPEEVLAKRKAGHCPPTSIVNLIFVLSNHAAPLSGLHFDGILNFLDLFLPKPLSSPDRGRAFLWLMYHYLESADGPNPFADTYARQTPGKAPLVRPLSMAETNRENVDTPEELEWGRKMSAQRNVFLQKLVSSMESDKKSKPAAPHFVPAAPQLNSSTSRTRSSRRNPDPSNEEGPFMYYVPGEDTSTPRERSHSRRTTYSAQSPPLPPPPAPPPKVEPVIDMEEHHRPLPTPVIADVPYQPRLQADGQSLLQQAWRSVMTSDPLLDSDEENADDDDLRSDYARRLNLISRIRGRPPTPEHHPHIIQSTFQPPSHSSAAFTGRWQRVESWD